MMDSKPEIVIDSAESQIGSPYVFGAWGEFCTPSSRRKRERSDHPTVKDKCQVLKGIAKNCDGCQWQGDRMFDCRGFTYWCLKQAGIEISGQTVTSQYNNKDNWIERGDISSMPECVCCVFMKGHTGLYIGNDRTIECAVGVQSKTLDNRWTKYAIPKGLYTAEEIDELRKNKPKPQKILRKGDTGDDVKKLQEILNNSGYDCGTVDGVFGKKTFNAVKSFQADHGLAADGIVGYKTWSVLMADKLEIPTFAVTVPHISQETVDKLLAQYPWAIVSMEGSGNDA